MNEDQSEDSKNTLIKSFFKYLLDASPWLLLVHSLILILWGSVALILYDVYNHVNKGNTVIGYFEKNIIKNRQHYINYTSLNKTTEDLLDGIRDDLGAKEVSVYLLHNGKASLGGIPFIKTSQFAVSNRDKKSIIHVIDEPINNVVNISDTLLDKIVWLKVEDYPESSAYRNALPENYPNDIIVRGGLIRTFQGVPHGWITAVFDGDKKFNFEEKKRVESILNNRTALFQGLFNVVLDPNESVDNRTQR